MSRKSLFPVSLLLAVGLVAQTTRSQVVMDLHLSRQINVGNGDAITGVTEFVTQKSGFARRRLTQKNGAGGYYVGPHIDLRRAGVGVLDLSRPGTVVRYTARYFQGKGNTAPYGDAPIWVILTDVAGRRLNVGVSYGVKPARRFPEWMTCVDEVSEVPTDTHASDFDLTKVASIEFGGTDWAGRGGDFVDIGRVQLISPPSKPPAVAVSDALQSGTAKPQSLAGFVRPPRDPKDVFCLEDYFHCVTISVRETVDRQHLQAQLDGRIAVAHGRLRIDPKTQKQYLQADWWAYQDRRLAAEQNALLPKVEVTCRKLVDAAALEEKYLRHEVRVTGVVCGSDPVRRSIFLWESEKRESAKAPRVDLGAIPSWRSPSFHVGERVTVTAVCCVEINAKDRKQAVLRVRDRADIIHHLPPGNRPRKLKTVVLSFDPVCPDHGGKRTHEVMGWNDPRVLVEQYISALKDASNGWCCYEIVDWFDMESHPLTKKGFHYDPDDYVEVWRNRKPAGTGTDRAGHKKALQSDPSDIPSLLTDKRYAHNRPLSIVQRVAAGKVDEVFLFGAPVALNAGEASMAGPTPFFINGPSYVLPEARRNFAIMGFNYERGVGCMLENFCHRTECTLSKVYKPKNLWFPTSPAAHHWDAFRMFDKQGRGLAANGICHYAPNSTSDYEWGNPKPVASTCDDWLYNWPNLRGESTRRTVTCEEWGGGDMAKHHVWWLSHLPNAPGQSKDGKEKNWWKYICDPDHVLGRMMR